MQPTNNPPSKTRVILTWVIMVVGIFVMAGLAFWFFRPAKSEQTESSPDFMHSIFYLFVGGFFLVAGVASYLVVILTGGFTFNYSQPVWEAVKAKQFVANIIVVIVFALGLGFILSAFVSPILVMLGLDSGMAMMLPVMVTVVLVQVVQLWVLVWSPIERRTIVRRLQAQGITPEQLRTAVFVGLSNPASGMAKRFAAIEEDMGGLWIAPDRLIFRGDREQFDLARHQVVQVERAVDKRSTSVLGGIAHVILHVQQSDNSIRQIRLHTEGHWTMGGKRRAMDALAETITAWQAG